jgi:heme/copper-type cytochrome/quinol oxidase subunit 1
MPRRVHDYPIVFMGWHSMSTAGHFLTMLGIIFFFLMFLDSHIEGRIATPITLGIPRWNKRVVYYVFKIRYLQFSYKSLNKLPNFTVRNYLISNYFNEYEVYINN